MGNRQAKFTQQARERREETRNHKESRVQRYHVRNRFHGVLYHLCGICGWISEHRLSRYSWSYQCPGCHVGIIPSINDNIIPPGRRLPPPDYVIPDNRGPGTIQEAFPAGDMEFWRSGGCVHGMTVMQDQLSASKFVALVRALATTRSIADAFEDVVSEYSL